MIRSVFRAVAFVLLSSLVFVANAGVRYSYTGNNYYNTSGTAFDTSMRIEGYFIIDQPLSPGLVGASIVPNVYSFSNGVGVINDTENPAQADFSIFTDTDGLIIYGGVELLERFPEELSIGDIRHRIIVQPQYDSTAIEEVIDQSGGTFFVTPVDTAYTQFGPLGVWSATLLPQIDVMLDKQDEDIIDLKRDKFVKVAILGGQSFDALQVDPLSVRFGPTGMEAGPARTRGGDVNKDGYADLVLTFITSETGIDCSDSGVLITGQLYSGPILAIEGKDTIVTDCP